MLNKVEIIYVEESENGDKIETIPEILAEGVYKYLKKNNYLKKEVEQKRRIEKMKDKMKELCK